MYSLYNNKTESGRIGKLHLAYDSPSPYGIVLMQINQLSLIYLEKQRIVRKYFTLAPRMGKSKLKFTLLKSK